MQSTELGILFEKAAFCILKKVFQYWGYDVAISKIQRSGTQYGFDLYFRIFKGLVTHNLFIECKASNSFNKVKQAELNDKIAQLNWTGFPRKDFHIFFSPTRAVDYNNQQLSIEDNDWPFVVVDWMRKQGEASPVLELFAAYEGNDADISAYTDHLFSKEIAPDFKTGKTFPQVCADLKSHLERRIEEHNDAADQADYRIINGTFWSRVQQNTHQESLNYYYTRTDSSPARLREVVANDYDVRNDRLEKQFDQVLRQAIAQKSAIIKILSRGGEGKSTFLCRIAKKLCSQHTVIWLDTLDCLTDIKQKIKRLDMEGALILLLDNAAIYGRESKRGQVSV